MVGNNRGKKKVMAIYFSTRTMQHFKRVQRLLDRLQGETEPMALVLPGSPYPCGDVIVFAGSFNPPTVAHLALLKQAWRYARLHAPMQLYAAFSRHTVDKETVERPLLLDRIVLLQKLLQRRIPQAGIMLFNRGLYLEQAEAIRRSFPKVQRIYFVLGFDKIVQIFDPRYYDDRDAALAALFSQAELLVAPRGNQDEDDLHKLLHQPQNERFARYVYSLPFDSAYRQISSTHVRQGIGDVAHAVPQEVRQFMRETRAYAPPLHKGETHELDYYGERVKLLSDLLAMPLS